MGVTELQYFFPNLQLTVMDFLPKCLGTHPEAASAYCQNYMEARKIHTVYGQKYDAKNPKFWEKVGLKEGAAKVYHCALMKACNKFMPQETLSDKGPGGGGWILFNWHMQVMKKSCSCKAGQCSCEAGKKLGDVWAEGRVFAVGDCNFGSIQRRCDAYIHFFRRFFFVAQVWARL